MEDNNGIVFDSVGISQSDETIATFYYGMINNENIKSIAIESPGENFDNIPLIKSNDKRFFLLKKRGEQVPYKVKGYDSNGEVEVIIEG